MGGFRTSDNNAVNEIASGVPVSPETDNGNSSNDFETSCRNSSQPMMGWIGEEQHAVANSSVLHQSGLEGSWLDNADIAKFPAAKHAEGRRLIGREQSMSQLLHTNASLGTIETLSSTGDALEANTSIVLEPKRPYTADTVATRVGDQYLHSVDRTEFDESGRTGRENGTQVCVERGASETSKAAMRRSKSAPRIRQSGPTQESRATQRDIVIMLHKQRDKLGLRSATPGPGTYNPPDSFSSPLVAAVSYSFGAKPTPPPDKSWKEGPGPAGYEVRDAVGRGVTHGARYMGGRSSRFETAPAKPQSPGPGTYEIPIPIEAVGAASRRIAKQAFHSTADNTRGQHNLWTVSLPFMGEAYQRSTNYGQWSPGPATYTLQSCIPRKPHNMWSSKLAHAIPETNTSKKLAPAVGQYDIPGTIGPTGDWRYTHRSGSIFGRLTADQVYHTETSPKRTPYIGCGHEKDFVLLHSPAHIYDPRDSHIVGATPINNHHRAHAFPRNVRF